MKAMELAESQKGSCREIAITLKTPAGEFCIGYPLGGVKANSSHLHADLRRGLTSTAPPGLEFWGSFHVFAPN